MRTLLPVERVSHIKNLANSILAKYKNIDNPYHLMSEIAKDHGITILQSELSEISGALRKEGDKWVIYVNSTDSERRKLFTIAHELGHYFVHKDLCNEFVDGQLISRNDQQKYAVNELEANEFAGNLIMPEEKIREMVTGQVTNDVLQKMAKSFGVSTLAMGTRLQNLGYAISI